MSRSQAFRPRLEVLEARCMPSGVYAGPDQTINEGDTAYFHGTLDDINIEDVTSIEWDFHFDLSTFVPQFSGSLTAQCQYPSYGVGEYYVGLRVTTNDGAVFMSGLTVFVNNVAPVVDVIGPGPAPEGSTVGFWLENLQDPDPTDTFTVWADWNHDGNFEYQDPDLTGNFAFVPHKYDQSGVYHPIIRVMDSNGAYTDYEQTVTITNVAPTADGFGPAEGSGNVGGGPLYFIGPGEPFRFTVVSDVSHADMVAGLTYYYSVDGGDFVASSSPEFVLPNYNENGYHTVSAYIEDQDGGVSNTFETEVFYVANPDTVVANKSSSYVTVSWVGGSAALGPDQYLQIAGMVDGLSVTVLTPGIQCYLQTNANFASVTGAGGDTLTVDTDDTLVLDGLSPSPESTGVGPRPYWSHGDIGNIYLPAGDATVGVSVLKVLSRGRLGNVLGDGGTYVRADELQFQGLTGSIQGFDRLPGIEADQYRAPDGWLGTANSQLVAAEHGIGGIWAYGVGATVHTDTDYDPDNTTPLGWVDIKDGGIPGVLDCGTVTADMGIWGDVNEFDAEWLAGSFQVLVPATVTTINLGAFGDNGPIFGQLANFQKINIDIWPGPVAKQGPITAAEIGTIRAKGFGANGVAGPAEAVITGNVIAGRIGNIIAQNAPLATDGSSTSLKVEGSIISYTRIGYIECDGYLNVSGDIIAGTGFGNFGFDVDGYLRARSIMAVTGDVPLVSVRGEDYAYLQTSILAPLGSVGEVFFDEWFETSGDRPFLVAANPVYGKITLISGGLPGSRLGGNLAIDGTLSRSGKIVAATIGEIDVGYIAAASITATFGDIEKVNATDTGHQRQILADITSIGGDLIDVEGGWVTGDIRAKRRGTDNRGGNIKRLVIHAFNVMDPNGNPVRTFKVPSLIRADNGIAPVWFKNDTVEYVASTVPATLTIMAQGGLNDQGEVSQDGIMVYSDGKFLGSVRVDYADALEEHRWKYKNLDTLVTINAPDTPGTQPQTRTWLLKNTGGTDTEVWVKATIQWTFEHADPEEFWSPTTHKLLTKGWDVRRPGV